MKPSTLLTLAHTPAWATLALGLALSLFATAAPAEEARTAAPSATSTLDVCINEANGKWRYSGVVTVHGAGEGKATASNQVQNQTSLTGFRNTLPAQAATIATRAGDTLVLPYVLEAAPLPLGVLRSVSTVQLYGQTGSPVGGLLAVQSATVAPDTVCGCAPKGCVRTQGYWGNKPNVVWPAPYNRKALFFSSGLTWQQVLDTPPRGSAYLILAHQTISAVLNRAAGASAPSGVQSTIDAATTWFRSGTTPATCGPGQCALQKTWAGTLDVYNNGLYPGAPKHCQ